MVLGRWVARLISFRTGRCSSRAVCTVSRSRSPAMLQRLPLGWLLRPGPAFSLCLVRLRGDYEEVVGLLDLFAHPPSPACLGSVTPRGRSPPSERCTAARGLSYAA